MKSVLSGIFVAFSMYSAIPVPQVNWEKKTMRWALIFSRLSASSLARYPGSGLLFAAFFVQIRCFMRLERH